MPEFLIPSLVGGGAIGWACASLRKIFGTPALFRSEGLSSGALLIVAAWLLARTLAVASQRL